ncbi:O-antigen/teichoic acid export membrane protein [Bradyrhizobium sp. GM2.2]|uniref:MOP flippase family protein n=1 Tax=Bradyrhizobium sp. GM2.2 TaxID=3156358 RepID=UPI003397C548
MDSPKSAISNVRWVALSQGGRVAISLASMAVFARLLPVSDFGLLAMATVVTNFAAIFRDMGTAAAVIQKPSLTDEAMETIFWSNVVFGVLTGFAVALVSDLVAWMFGQARLGLILKLLSFSFPIVGLAAAHLALLERTNRFRSVALVEVISALIGAAVGIGAAVEGYGILGLIAQTLLTAAISSCSFLMISKWRPAMRWSSSEFSALFHFSGNLVGFNFINYFARNADSVLIGRFLGPDQLGPYNASYRLMLFPLSSLTLIINRALFPIYSRQQGDRWALGRTYLEVLKLISVITAPLMFGLWAVRGPFVHVVLGPEWADAAGIIAWLAPVGYLQSLVSTTGSVMMATGRTDILRNLGLINSAIVVLSFVLGLNGGAVGVAQAYFFANLFVTMISLHSTLSHIHQSLLHLVRSILLPLLFAGVMSCVVVAADWMIFSHNFLMVVRLLCLVCVGLVTYTVLLTLFAHKTMSNSMRLLLGRSLAS